jgi:TPR repeat protein
VVYFKLIGSSKRVKTTNKPYILIFLLFPITLLLFLHGCDKRDTREEDPWEVVGTVTLEEIFELTKNSAEAGNAEAQFELGWMYFNGEGVPKNTAKAEKWFRKSAEQENAGAQTQLRFMHYVGEGMARDYGKVLE